MNGGDSLALKKARQKRNDKKKNIRMASRSNVLKKIIGSLINEEYQHMLYWHDRSKNEFFIKFVHMNSKEFKKRDYLELFKDLDRLSNSYEEYVKDEKYNHNCKVRCKSNLKKLCDGGALTLIEKINKEKSIQLRKYKLNYSSLLSEKNETNGGDMKRICNVTNVYISMPMAINPIASLVSSPLIEAPYVIKNGNEGSRNAMVTGPLITSSVEYAKLDVNCSASNGNEIFLVNNSTVYEQEKHMHEKVVTFPAKFTESSVSYGSMNGPSIQENEELKLMEYNAIFFQNEQINREIQSVVTFPNKSTESSASYGSEISPSIDEKGKFNTMEHYTSFVQKEQDSSEIPSVSEFQHAVVESNGSQLVPHSPSGIEGIFDLSDPFCDYSMDYKSSLHMPMQHDDPLLSSTSTDSSSAFSDFSDDSPLNTELQDFYSFENLISMD